MVDHAGALWVEVVGVVETGDFAATVRAVVQQVEDRQVALAAAARRLGPRVFLGRADKFRPEFEPGAGRVADRVELRQVRLRDDGRDPEPSRAAEQVGDGREPSPDCRGGESPIGQRRDVSGHERVDHARRLGE